MDLPSGFREIPRISTDNDGSSGGIVTYVDRSGWGDVECGTSQASIASRVANCAAIVTIASEATWDGAIKGNAGQGVWKLVTRKNYAGRIPRLLNSINRRVRLWKFRNFLELNSSENVP